MWKNTLALGFLCLSASILVQTVAPAFARTGKTSFGTNPAFSKSQYTSGSVETLTAVVGQERVITDIYLSAQPNYDLEAIITTSGGVEIGRFKSWNYNGHSSGPYNVSLESGLRVPEGEDLILTFNGNGAYTVSGYLSHP